MYRLENEKWTKEVHLDKYIHFSNHRVHGAWSLSTLEQGKNKDQTLTIARKTWCVKRLLAKYKSVSQKTIINKSIASMSWCRGKIVAKE